MAGRDYVDALPAGRTLPNTPADLSGHARIVYTELGTGNVWDFTAPDGSIDAIRVEGPLQTNSSEVVRTSVLGGLGIAYAPWWLLQDVLVGRDVRVLLPEWSTRSLPMHLVSPPQRRQTAKVRAIADHVARGLAGANEGDPMP